MKTKQGRTKGMAGDIEETEAKLRELERAVERIGGPAGYLLRHRLKTLRIEENALQRNYASAARRARKSSPDARRRAAHQARMEKIQSLLHHIEQEEVSLGHDTEFLHQASPTTLELMFEAGARLFDRGARRLNKARIPHPRIWHSPFVNHTHEHLSERFGFTNSDRR